MKHAVRVTIAGQDFALRTELTPDEAGRVADFVNGRIEEVTEASGLDTRQAVVLAFLKLAAEFLSGDRRRDDELLEVRGRIDALADQLEEKLGNSQPALDFAPAGSEKD